MKPARTTLLKVLVAVALVTPAAFSAEPRAVTWAQQRKDRDAQVERHLETARDGYRWFAPAARGKVTLTCAASIWHARALAYAAAWPARKDSPLPHLV